MSEEKSLVLSETLVNELIPNTTISPEALTKICNRLPELQRAKSAVGRKNSQTTSTLMTMTMLADSPYRQMKQCLSQIDNKRNALMHFVYYLSVTNIVSSDDKDYLLTSSLSLE